MYTITSGCLTQTDTKLTIRLNIFVIYDFFATECGFHDYFSSFCGFVLLHERFNFLRFICHKMKGENVEILFCNGESDLD